MLLHNKNMLGISNTRQSVWLNGDLIIQERFVMF